MSEEALSHGKGSRFALLQLLEKELAVELIDFFNVAKHDVTLTTHRLGDVLSHQLRDEVL